MDNPPDPFVFFQVSSAFAREAFAFHQSVSSSNEHIWPRTEAEIERFSEQGELFGIRGASSGEFVGLCYATLEGEEWEIGGLIVSKAAQDLGLGTVLVRFALAHTIAYNRPWFYGQKIIAHVHEANADPRNIIGRIGYKHICQIEVPAEKAPPSMKRNEEGKLIGHKFEFPQESLPALLRWFEEFDGTLRDRTTPAIFEIKSGGLGSLISALREAVADSRSR
jgi:GNAT superfamily N-acetyltransferase